MTAIPNVTLNNGVEMPQLGFGVFQVPPVETRTAVEVALEAGYRSIDTAAIYGNEEGVGQALGASGLARDELFVTTKLWISNLGPTAPHSAIDASLEALGLDHVDLYLIHWPAPATDDYLDAWQALEEIASAGKSRAIGVSNFLPEHLDRVVSLGGSVPAVNQVEFHPALQQRNIVEANQRLGIATEGWSPLAKGEVLGDGPVVVAAEAHGVTPAQAVIRWHLQHDAIVIPKSVTPSRIASNLDVFGFELTDTEMAAIDGLERGLRTGPDPAHFHA